MQFFSLLCYPQLVLIPCYTLEPAADYKQLARICLIELEIYGTVNIIKTIQGSYMKCLHFFSALLSIFPASQVYLPSLNVSGKHKSVAGNKCPVPFQEFNPDENRKKNKKKKKKKKKHTNRYCTCQQSDSDPHGPLVLSS